MSSPDRILTLHPEGKQGVRIDKAKYEAMRAAILGALGGEDEMSLAEIRAGVVEALSGNFDGSIGWYFMAVKLDLEARGELRRLEGRGPQRLARGS